MEENGNGETSSGGGEVEINLYEMKTSLVFSNVRQGWREPVGAVTRQ